MPRVFIVVVVEVALTSIRRFRYLPFSDSPRRIVLRAGNRYILLLKYLPVTTIVIILSVVVFPVIFYF